MLPVATEPFAFIIILPFLVKRPGLFESSSTANFISCSVGFSSPASFKTSMAYSSLVEATITFSPIISKSPKAFIVLFKLLVKSTLSIRAIVFCITSDFNLATLSTDSILPSSFFKNLDSLACISSEITPSFSCESSTDNSSFMIFMFSCTSLPSSDS